MDVYVKDWWECPFRVKRNPDNKYIGVSYWFHGPHGHVYAEGNCELTQSEEAPPLLCPQTRLTRKAKVLVGAAPYEYPLRKEPIIVKPSPKL